MNFFMKNNKPCYECNDQYAAGGQMIKRADGSYSQKGFWDYIRENAGSGKKPTKEMLAMEEKLNKGEYGGQPQNAGFQALPNYVQEKILSRMDEGGEPNGGMALGQIMSVADKMNMLSKFISPDKNLDPWIASKLAVMDDSAAAIADYMMYNPEAKEEGKEEDENENEMNENEEMDEMRNGGINIDPSKKGTFKAQATRMGMSVQEAASHIMANKEDFSPEMVKKAVFAHNFANQFGGIVDEDFEKYMNGEDVELPKAFLGAVVPLAMSALGAGAGAGAAAGAAGAAGSAGAGSALAGAAAKGMGSKLMGQFASKGLGQLGNITSGAANSPTITTSNLANAASLPDTGPLSWFKAAIGAGTALSNVAGTITSPFAGASPISKFAGKSDNQSPTDYMNMKKLGAPKKIDLQQYDQFMPQRDVFQEGMPLKQQVGPLAEYGGMLPKYQGVDDFGNFTSSLVLPNLNGINLGQSLYGKSAVGQQANTLGAQLSQVQNANTSQMMYDNSASGQQAAQLKQENPFAAGLNNVIQQPAAPQIGTPPALTAGSGAGFDRTMGFISGMSMFNNVLEANQNKKAAKKWQRENTGNTDLVYNPTPVDSPFGLYDPNTGVLKPKDKVATQDFGTTGVAKCGGQKMYREGGTYMLSKDDIMKILAAGGEIEFM